MIEIRNLRKRFGEVRAVDGISFTAPNGAVTGVLGENGAGKTTTLAMLSGLLAPDSGSILIDGTSGVPTGIRGRIGALLDHQGLYPRLTARENIAYFGELQGLSGVVLDRHVEHIMGLLGLDRIADRPSGVLSQGERLKVALGRAIVHSPQHLLLDEVTNGLDVRTVRSLRRLLHALRDEGRCIVFSSHVIEEVRSLSDQIVVLSKGRLVADGSADAICRRAGSTTLEDAFVTLTALEGTSSCGPF